MLAGGLSPPLGAARKIGSGTRGCKPPSSIEMKTLRGGLTDARAYVINNICCKSHMIKDE
jgi:hypothetical protein